MDPEATLDELLELTTPLLNQGSPAEGTLHRLNAARIAELVHALDGWLMIGGYLPRRWAAGRRPR